MIQLDVVLQVFLVTQGDKTCISAFSHVNRNMYRTDEAPQIPTLEVYNRRLEIGGINP